MSRELAIVNNNESPWMKAAKDAIADAAPADKLKTIIQKQIELAESGDKSAIRFVFETLPKLMATSAPTTAVQNNYYNGDESSKSSQLQLAGSRSLKITLFKDDDVAGVWQFIVEPLGFGGETESGSVNAADSDAAMRQLEIKLKMPPLAWKRDDHFYEATVTPAQLAAS